MNLKRVRKYFESKGTGQIKICQLLHELNQIPVEEKKQDGI